MARELHRATHGLPGPRIPFDKQYRKNSMVFYRYGAFSSSADGTPRFIRAPGRRRYRDKRAPGRAVPTWLQDPFQKPGAKNSKWRGLITRNLLVFKGHAQRGKGGVYEAVDLSVLPVRRVIVKEGRRHGETNWDGRDGYALVSTRPKFCANCAKLVCPFPSFFASSPKTAIATSSSKKSLGGPCLPPPACNRQERPGDEQRRSLGNWDPCLPNCTPPAGCGVIANPHTSYPTEERGA